jgi:predicted methyltransferase
LAALVCVGPAFSQPMPADISLSAIRKDERERDQREKLPEIVHALHLISGSTVGDLGTGYAYYAARFSPVVGPMGRVFAEEIDAPLIAKVRERLRADHINNVTPLLGTPADPGFPKSSLDAVLIADVYHEISEPATVLLHVGQALKPGGFVMIIDYLKPELRDRLRQDQVREHNIAPGFVEKDLKEAGFTIIERRDPYCTGYDGIPMYFVLARR